MVTIIVHSALFPRPGQGSACFRGGGLALTGYTAMSVTCWKNLLCREVRPTHRVCKAGRSEARPCVCLFRTGKERAGLSNAALNETQARSRLPTLPCGPRPSAPSTALPALDLAFPWLCLGQFSSRHAPRPFLLEDPRSQRPASVPLKLSWIIPATGSFSHQLPLEGAPLA